MTTVSSKTTPLPIRFPNDLAERIREDAYHLRRSKASIVIEIVEKHYVPNNGKAKKPARKLAGQ
jgi:predicted DNA-binding protein